MAKCAYCGERKGKRVCPAVGPICSPCCGLHRVRDIECPDDCPFLEQVHKGVQEAFIPAVNKLKLFTMDELREWARPGVEAFLDAERRIYEWEHSTFVSYLMYGLKDGNGDRAIDIFLSRRGRSLSRNERTALENLSQAWVSLFEVFEVRLDEGLGLSDLVTGREIFVRERTGTHNTTAGDLLLAWVMPFRDHLQFAGGITQVGLAHGDEVIETIERELERLRRDNPGAAVKDLLPAAMPRTHRVLREAVRTWRPPKLRTPDGEEMALCRAVYEVVDPDAARAKLEKHKDLTQADEGLFFVREKGDAARGGPHAPPTQIAMRTVRLTVEAGTRRRLEAGKRLVQRALGRLVRHRLDRVEDLETLAREERLDGGEDDGPPPLTLPADMDPDERRSLVEEHLERWAATTEERDGERRDGEGKTSPGGAGRGDADGGITGPGGAGREGDGERQGYHRVPPLAHEVMYRLVPRLQRTVRKATLTECVRRCRKELRAMRRGEMEELGLVEDFLHGHAQSLVSQGVPKTSAVRDAGYLASHCFYMINHELQFRKTFWVDESLAWMLSQTELDIEGRMLQLPFSSCAIVFTDPWTLELGASLLSQEDGCKIRNEPLKVLTVYAVAGSRQGDGRGVHLHFLFDSGRGGWPYLVARDLFVRDEDRLNAILDSHFPDVAAERLDALFHAPELKKLLHVVVNTILYSTTAHLDPILLASPRRKRKGRRGRRAGAARGPDGPDKAYSDDEVFHFPGKIEISRIRKLLDLEKTDRGRKIMKRFMVRGHWRKAAKNWKDQRLRWIKPHWKGPDIAMVIEREYRVKP